ncbi:mitochondrial inner membrane protease subunit 1-like [Chenopodium quinoa]|uniref:mitochondrial inner membrane protease subunit 1-like n=1 Tax=Chenopodium quinoa TaxID=63459 RepID=UPI000B7866B7|nr:mitochondrial inner membrane protease subunit 1-like [Chenopodium quinoa]
MFASKLRQWRNIAKEAVNRTIIIAKFLSLFHITETYIFSPTIVYGPSMLPTLNIRGDVLLVDKFSHRIGNLELGDVVIVKSPQNPRRTLTKRILGMEGDVVSFNSNTGFLKTLVVPKGHVWIQGDNLYASNDSRHFGSVPYGLIQGKAFCRIWPFAEFGSLGSG